MHSTHTLVHTPGTAGRADLVESPRLRAPVARGASPIARGGERADATGLDAQSQARGGPGELVLGRYSLCERLGAGGFGVVWRARDELLGREVALKRISLPDGDSERASREALAAARLAHPAIVALYEACAASDAFYLISELVRGETLAGLIATRALDDERVLGIGIALADALAHAHARGVIHRDVKPQNVLVPSDSQAVAPAPRGLPAVAKLTDFGGASLAGDDVLTRTGDVLGTLAYMAPEQSDGGEVGEAADLYSLALILYEAFSGVNPVRGPTAAATARRIGRPLEPLARSRGDLPAPLTCALDRALAARPADRGTLEQLRAALAQALALGAEGGPARGRPLARVRLAAERTRAGRPRAEVSTWAAAPASAEGWEAAPALRAWQAPLSQQTAPRASPPRARATSRPRHEPRPAYEPRPPQERRPAASGPARAEASGGRRTHAALARALWIGCAVATMAWEAWSGRVGVALLMLAAIAPLVALSSPRRSDTEQQSATIAGRNLLAGALAPILGLASLAGAFPAIAGQASRWRTRAALGALGYWWLTLGEPLLARRLWLGPAPGTPPRAAWEGSVSSAAVHVLGPVLSFGVLFGAALWGAAAVCLPWMVRGRRAAFDVVAVTVWSAALAAAAPLVDHGLSATAAHGSPRGAVLGAVIGGVLAVAARALRGPV